MTENSKKSQTGRPRLTQHPLFRTFCVYCTYAILWCAIDALAFHNPSSMFYKKTEEERKAVSSLFLLSGLLIVPLGLSFLLCCCAGCPSVSNASEESNGSSTGPARSPASNVSTGSRSSRRTRDDIEAQSHTRSANGTAPVSTRVRRCFHEGVPSGRLTL